MNITFAYLKSTKNFDVFRELDSGGVMFPDDWKLLSAHPELHNVGSIYVRRGALGGETHPAKITVTITAVAA